MMLTIKEEILVFLTAISTGVVIRVGYHCISCFRGIVKHRLLMIEIEDLLFWIAGAVYVFVQIYHTSDGSVRWYFVLGLVIGAAISTIFLRKWKKMTKKIYDFHVSKNIAKRTKKRYYYK